MLDGKENNMKQRSLAGYSVAGWEIYRKRPTMKQTVKK
jgi:hypothetical protein